MSFLSGNILKNFKKKNKRKNSKINYQRSGFLFGTFIVIAILIIKEFFMIQVLKNDFYEVEASKVRDLAKTIFPRRGDIFMIEKDERYKYEVAFNSQDSYTYLIFADTTVLNEKNYILNFFKEYTDISEEELNKKLEKKNDPYIVLTKNIKNDIEKKIEKKIKVVEKKLIKKEKDNNKKIIDSFLEENSWNFLFLINEDELSVDKTKKESYMDQKIEDLIEKGIQGLYFRPEGKRIYPNSSLASQVIGFSSYREGAQLMGQYGVEQYYNDDLKGVYGEIEGEKDALGNWIVPAERIIKPKKDGANLILTLDRMVQYQTEKILKEAIEDYKAEAGSVIIMKPQDGSILAMANYPTFDPNNYSKVTNQEIFLNPCIHSVYEPGSIFKPITMSAALDSGKISKKTEFYDKGYYQPTDFSERPIKNSNNAVYGKVTMSGIIEKSINTGSIFVMQQTGKETFADYVRRFGFGEGTGIDLLSESKGNINSLDNYSGDVNFATASFGQGITVTPIEMVTAISAIANQGKLLTPHVVNKIISADEQEIKEPFAKNSEHSIQVIKPSTAISITDMMVASVETGFSNTAKIDNYKIAGKTGTAQIPDKEKGGYQEEDTIHSFIGFFPAYNPEFTILVKLDKPDVKYAMDSVGPVFKKIAEYLIDYYDINPSE